MGDRTYLAIDLKSFYASVECVERSLNPMTTNLVVADRNRTEKTICLAVSPSLKAYGIPGRARLFEVVQKVKEANALRLCRAPNHTFSGSSYHDTMLKECPELAIDYVVAPPRMALYMEYSSRIYQVYLKHIAPEDIHVYSIDEIFIDATNYLKTYSLSPQELARRIILDVLETTGITATAGIGPNLYLCKVAMDIEAKHIPPDEKGVRIAQLDEQSYRRALWQHRPLTDFWRIGRGYAKKLEEHGLYTMGDIARCSLGRPDDFYNEDLLYRLFGVNAELLIDHAWGWEPCTIADIKAFQPSSNSVGSGQVLLSPYPFDRARLVAREMMDLLTLELVDHGLVTNQLTLTVGYDIENLIDPIQKSRYQGAITTDRYGRSVPKHAHGTANLNRYTSSTKVLLEELSQLFDKIVNPELWVRRIHITANHVVFEHTLSAESPCEQLNLFTDYHALQESQRQEEADLLREKHMQEAILSIKKRFGKNSILKGMNILEGATAKDRNRQIGGHRA